MSISIDLARRILEACKHRARDLRSPASIAIVDAGGHLVLFERMMAPYGWADRRYQHCQSLYIRYVQSIDRLRGTLGRGNSRVCR